MKKIAKLISWTSHILVLTVFIEVIFRYTMGKSSAAFTDIQVYAFSAMFLLGASYTLSEDGHVNIDLLYGKMSKKRQDFVKCFGLLFFLLPFCGIVIYTSWAYWEVSFSLSEKSTDSGGLPFRFVLKSLIPIGFAMLMIEAIRQIFGILLGQKSNA